MPELIDRKYLLAYLAEIKPDEYVSAFGEAAVQVIGLIEEFVKEMPTIEPEVRPIDANALIAKLKIDTNTATYSDYCNGYCDARQVDLDAIDAAPTIEPEVRRWRWIPVTSGRGGHECDQCHNYAPSYQTGKEHLSNYCPNCCARMNGGSDNEA